MGSKRPKKAKKDLESALKDKTDEVQGLQVNDINIPNETPVTPKPVKRKRKQADDPNQAPKKVKKLNPPKLLNGESSIKKVTPRKKKIKLNDKPNGLPHEPLLNGVSEQIKTDFIGNNVECIAPQLPIQPVQNIAKPQNKKKKRIEITWPDVDVQHLLTQIEKTVPEKDALAYRSRVEKINWNDIAFNNYSAEECKKTWSLVLKRMRRFRLLREILKDARAWISTPKTTKPYTLKRSHKRRHPQMPKRPLSSYLLFYLNQKDQIANEHPELEKSELTKLAGQIYKNLPPDKKLHYDECAATLKEEYLEKRRIFYENHPELMPQVRASHKTQEKTPKVETVKADKPAKVEKLPKPAKPKSPKTEKPPKAEKSKKVEKAPKPEKPKKDRLPKRFQTPFGLYFATEVKNRPEGVDKSVYKEQIKNQYKLMAACKKVLWINLAEQDLTRYQEEAKRFKETHPDYMILKPRSVLTKEEKAVKERAAGKPARPANSAYGLYSRMMLKSDEIKNIHPKDRMNLIANKWKDCAEEEKNLYKDKMLDLNEQYKLEYAAYVESLPEEERRKIVDAQKKQKTKVVRKPKEGKRKSPRKTKKEQIKEEVKFQEPEQPPISACKYFSKIYDGEGDAVQAWKALSADEKKHYEEELVKKKQAYIVEFERFLKSLSKEELEAFSKSRQQQVRSEDEDDSSACSSGSEGEDAGDDEEIENDENDSDSE